jgi:ubiquinone/menaquinone biosynthesis C-methylase UbiE
MSNPNVNAEKQSTSTSSPKKNIPMYWVDVLDLLSRPNIGWWSSSWTFLRQKIWIWFYEFVSRLGKNDTQWQFINYGYKPDNSKDLIVLDPKDHEMIHDKCGTTCLQLYHEVVKPILPIVGKNVVEIGSGRGGGAVYMAKYYQPKTLTCIEISRDSVLFANQYQKPKCPDVLHFQQGDATTLSLPDQSYDVVVNIESAHCYSNFKQFVQEVYRILKPGGSFVMCDLRLAKYVAGLEDEMKQVGFVIVEEVTITPQVLRSMELSTSSRHTLMEQLAGKRLYHLFAGVLDDFAGLRNSQMYDNFISGYSIYKRYVLRKPE